MYAAEILLNTIRERNNRVDMQFDGNALVRFLIFMYHLTFSAYMACYDTYYTVKHFSEYFILIRLRLNHTCFACDKMRVGLFNERCSYDKNGGNTI